MKLKLRNIIVTFVTSVFLTASVGMTAQAPRAIAPNKVSAKIDTVTMTMGERTTVHVEVLKNGHVGETLLPIDKRRPVGLPDEEERSMMGNIEVRGIEADSTELGNGRVQVNYDILIQPFNHGDLSIPPFKYVIDGDTITSNSLALKVLEPEMPAEMVDSLWINPMRGTLSIESEWYDWVPDWFTEYWYWWIPIVVVLALGIVVLVLYKKNGKTLLPRKKRIPPYVLAMRRLDELKRKKLHQSGHTKAYYTELTDILRQYLGGRFKIYALEMTSTQIMDAMASKPETAPFVEELRPMFRIADFVKFAKQDATTDENIRSFNEVKKFVEETRPAEPEETKPTMVRKKKPGKGKRTKGSSVTRRRRSRR